MQAQPGPSDAVTVIEVAGSSLAYDSGKKRKAYARACIADYWIVGLDAREVTILREPAGEGYASRRVVRSTDVVSLHEFPDDPFDITNFLP